MQINHTDTFDASVSTTLQMLLNISRLILAKFTEHTQNHSWHLWPAAGSDTKWQQGLHPTTLPSLGSWCTFRTKPEETKLPSKSRNSQFFSINRFKLPIATAKGETATTGLHSDFVQHQENPADSEDADNQLTTLHPLSQKLFFTFLLRTLINKFNHIERSACILWWYFLDKTLLTGGITHQSQCTPAFFN